MPPTFQEREQAFEAKFARDAEFRFRLQARRDKLFAAWAAAALHLSAEAGAELRKAVLAIADGPNHDAAMLRHIADAFARQQQEGSATALHAALERCALQAREQLLSSPQGDITLRTD